MQVCRLSISIFHVSHFGVHFVRPCVLLLSVLSEFGGPSFVTPVLRVLSASVVCSVVSRVCQGCLQEICTRLQEFRSSTYVTRSSRRHSGFGPRLDQLFVHC